MNALPNEKNTVALDCEFVETAYSVDSLGWYHYLTNYNIFETPLQLYLIMKIWRFLIYDELLIYTFISFYTYVLLVLITHIQVITMI